MATLWSDFYDESSLYAKFTTFEEFNYSLHISLKHRYIYVETAKVACSTIKLTLQRLELENINFTRERFQDIHNREFSPLLRIQQIPNFPSFIENPSYFRFCFVRNPYTRLLAAYLNKIEGNSRLEKELILQQLGYNRRDLAISVSFAEFVAAIEAQPPSMMNNHWRHQYYSTFQDSINYQFIGRLENFNDDFSYVLERLGKGTHKYYTPEVRHQTSSASKLREYYTEDLVNKVYALYEKDFLYFGYDKELPVS